tara:strand:+ start:18180 stop:18305 length:126 start_codon:yes stop_codon:yes gene_type:complete
MFIFLAFLQLNQKGYEKQWFFVYMACLTLKVIIFNHKKHLK